MTWSGRETLANVTVSLPDILEWSGDTSRFAGVIGRSSQKSGSGWEALSDVR